MQQAHAFTESAKFMAKFGRAADAGGQAYWTGAIDSGAASRAGVVIGFSESQEHQLKLAPSIEARGIIVG